LTVGPKQDYNYIWWDIYSRQGTFIQQENAMVEFAERATGAILGMAIGDALGAVVEGLHAQRIADWFGQLRDFDQARDFYQSLSERTDLPSRVVISHRQRWRMPGLYTDDTQQALLLIESLVQSGKADHHDYARRITECLRATQTPDLPLGLFRGCGPGFREIAHRLLSGQSPDATGVDSAGNGASMRIAPVGLFYHDNPIEAGRGAVEISVLTHRDSRAILAAASIAMAVSLAAQRIGIDSRRGFFQELIDLVKELCIELADYPMLSGPTQARLCQQYIEAMENLKPHLGDSYPTAATVVSHFASQVSETYLTAESPFCLCSVLMGFWHFLHFGDSIEEAIVSAVNAGGDTDTIAAMTGAMIGALRGKRAIPGAWLRELVNRQQVELRAKALITGTIDQPDWKPFIEMEKELTLQEIAQRQQLIAAETLAE
jgi:ADP-ribosylglycohydrolase